jgi:hypothetical protein
MAKYTDSQLRSMTEVPWMWSDQLRDEAERRNLAVTLVTPLTEVVSLLKASLKVATVLLVFVFAGSGCKPSRWEGVPENRKCGVDNPNYETTCIADGKVYVCVRDGDVVYCSRDTVEIKCTNIVNVETVCPGKP